MRPEEKNFVTDYKSLFLVLTFFLFVGIPCFSQQQKNSLEALYARLDDAIARSPEYVAKREARIDKLKQTLRRSESQQDRYDVCFHIFEEYKSYISDSAMAYLERCETLARQMGDRTGGADCLALMAFQCSTVGMYNEALSALHDIDRSDLDKKGLGDYYVAMNHVYGELGYYSKVQSLSQRYFKQADLYCDSLFMALDPNSEMALTKKESRLLSQDKFREAMEINERRMAMVKEGTHEYAIVAYYRHLIYERQGKKDLSMEWLAKSAICDIENAIMDQASLWTLAHCVNDGKDVERSNRYINFAWTAANTFGTRIRNWQISPILGSIDQSYQLKIKKTNSMLKILIGVLGLMTLLMMLLLYYLNKQRGNLKKAQDSLKQSNAELESVNGRLTGMNEQLDGANRKLSDNNAELSGLNSRLNESNRVKEEYIGRFLGLCSLYVDKMDSYRQQVNRMMKNNQLDELFRMTRDTEQKERELDELYTNFDAVFLNLFPNFVDDLNSLLKEDYKINLTDPKKLTTPVRVFALIRLGVDDSSKIAEYLHYSVNTIYNYRAKLRNGALGDRNDFERKVKELGMAADRDHAPQS